MKELKAYLESNKIEYLELKTGFLVLRRSWTFETFGMMLDQITVLDTTFLIQPKEIKQ